MVDYCNRAERSEPVQTIRLALVAAVVAGSYLPVSLLMEIVADVVGLLFELPRGASLHPSTKQGLVLYCIVGVFWLASTAHLIRRVRGLFQGYSALPSAIALVAIGLSIASAGIKVSLSELSVPWSLLWDFCFAVAGAGGWLGLAYFLFRPLARTVSVDLFATRTVGIVAGVATVGMFAWPVYYGLVAMDGAPVAASWQVLIVAVAWGCGALLMIHLYYFRLRELKSNKNSIG